MRVTCIMPTANRRLFIPAAIRLFRNQDYPNKELIILDDGRDPVEDLVPNDLELRYIRELPSRLTLGAKRNIACDLASGDVILHWDDDDWYAPWRISYQIQSMEKNGLDLCGLNRAYFVDAAARTAWEYTQISRGTRWLCGATLGYRKEFWRHHPFANIRVSEDNRFIAQSRTGNLASLEDNRFFVCRIHSRNTCTKRPRGRFWPERPFSLIQSLIGQDWDRNFGGDEGLPRD